MLPVILSGGSGTRLWPLSTPDVPKQFLPLMDPEKTLIQQTVERLNGLSFVSDPLVICNEKHLPLVQKQLSSINKLHRPVMLEPIGRNTAPAITAAALYCKQHEKDGLMCVLASDHAIVNVPVFQKAVELAREAALNSKYALFGIVPDRPETGYGYIETKMNGSAKSYPVQSFREKPDAATAAKYIAQKNYFWNSGMFVIPADLLLKEMAERDGDMLSKTEAAYNNAQKDDSCIRLDKTSFESIKGNSIDYVVMEHTKNAVVVPLDAGWSDVGSWDMVWALSQKDEEQNVINSHTFCKDASGNLIYTTRPGRPVALLGIKDCIVIESESGLLIADRRYVQDVKKAAEEFIKK
jgi:mannose-1-phosphate guanylyltransferase/mannose-6-phosphate isomerase